MGLFKDKELRAFLGFNPEIRPYMDFKGRLASADVLENLVYDINLRLNEVYDYLNIERKTLSEKTVLVKKKGKYDNR